MKYKFVSQSSVYEKTQQHEDVAAKAVDGDLFTHTQTAGHGSNNNWTVVFYTERNISCFTIVVREGTSFFGMNYNFFLLAYLKPKIQKSFYDHLLFLIRRLSVSLSVCQSLSISVSPSNF